MLRYNVPEEAKLLRFSRNFGYELTSGDAGDAFDVTHE
jgi:hypothetical protein